MNERLRRIVRESHLDVYGLGTDRAKWEATLEKFLVLLGDECIDNLRENGHGEAARQLDWFISITMSRPFGGKE